MGAPAPPPPASVVPFWSRPWLCPFLLCGSGFLSLDLSVAFSLSVGFGLSLCFSSSCCFSLSTCSFLVGPENLLPTNQTLVFPKSVIQTQPQALHLRWSGDFNPVQSLCKFLLERTASQIPDPGVQSRLSFPSQSELLPCSCNTYVAADLCLAGPDGGSPDWGPPG